MRRDDPPRVQITAVTSADADAICALLHHPDVRRYLCDDTLIPREDVVRSIVESLDPSSLTRYWIIVTADGQRAGLVGVRPPSTAAMRLRPIGWRSLELVVALDPAHWGRGYAREAIETVAEHAGRDGVTFALLAAVDMPNTRSHRLMQACDFAELGRVRGAVHELVVYERAV